MTSDLNEVDTKRYCREGDRGNADAFTQLFRGSVLFETKEQKWYLFYGHTWHENKANHVNTLLSHALNGVYTAALTELSAECASIAESKKEADVERRAEIKHLMTLIGEQIARINGFAGTKSALDFAASALAREVAWNITPHVLPVKNGVLDLATGELRGGKPEDYFRWIAPVEWNGIDTSAPRWTRFLHEILDGDTAVIAYLQRLFGYALSGAGIEPALPVLTGTAQSGKGTLLGVLGRLMGDYGVIGAHALMISGRGATDGAPAPHLMDLRGRRLVWVSETNRDADWNIAQAKHLTGTGPLSARTHYKEQETFYQTHLLCLMTNHVPTAPLDEDALWTRMSIVNFPFTFVEHPDPTKPNQRKADRTLGATLDAEASGILAWLVRGYQAWCAEQLNVPPSVRDALGRHLNEHDPLATFVYENCLISDDAEVPVRDMYHRYVIWARDVDAGGQPLSNIKFSRALRAGKRGDRISNTKEEPRTKRAIWTGITLRQV